MEGGFCSECVVASAQVDMYAKCGDIHEECEMYDIPQNNLFSCTTMIAGYAQNVVLHEVSRFSEQMPQRNVILWNAMISGYAQNGFVDKGLRTFKQMQLASVKPVSTAFISTLSACQNGFLEQRMNIHLNDMHRMDLLKKASETFEQMQLVCAKPNFISFASILRVCAKIKALEQAMDHQSMNECGYLSDIKVASTFVDIYLTLWKHKIVSTNNGHLCKDGVIVDQP
ncbi:pentatricopeptide repeat-containing protein At2g22410, mitochondrial-like [Cryptomeria japonica]|uniref:pentatricopeptide repeat-containing protein At2g22410, mitochondrial-like n=1 Tax=Cryptomeria japonica TaxID=3369 RepID=UPI0025ACFE3C|nr:pentatricopeptide repeat-containing protein At2g22410, mitochondrial-like [Cryptomeria japonica]